MSKTAYLARQDLTTAQYTVAANGTAVAAGDVVVLNATSKKIGVAQAAIAVGETGVVIIEGIFDVFTDTVTLTSGEALYMDGNGDWTKTVSTNTLVGYAVAATTSAGYTRIKIGF